MNKIKCSNCDKDILRKVKKDQSKYFCNRQCYGEWLKTHRPWNFKGQVPAICDTCGKQFLRDKCHIKERNYCSKKCYTESKKKQIGKNHPLYIDRVRVKCEVCGIVFERLEYRLNRSKRHFCSIDCKKAFTFKVEVTCNWCGKIKLRSKSHAENRQTHFCSRECFKAAVLLNKPSKETLPEKTVRQYFERENIPFKQYEIINDKFNVDFLLPDNASKGVVIEVLGDYWHCHPNRYQTPISVSQKKTIKQDKSRYNYLTKCGYVVFGIWECDIKENVKNALKPVFDYLETGMVTLFWRFEHLREVNTNG